MRRNDREGKRGGSEENANVIHLTGGGVSGLTGMMAVSRQRELQWLTYLNKGMHYSFQ